MAGSAKLHIGTWSAFADWRIGAMAGSAKLHIGTWSAFADWRIGA
jgi:hypothetical protein